MDDASFSPTAFSHVKSTDTAFVTDGLRDFFLYRDLGVAAATNGKVIAQLVKANLPPADGTGWHRHVADFHIVLMLKGWARFMYEDKVTLVEAGDCVHQRPGICHTCSTIHRTWNISKSRARRISELSMRLRPATRCRRSHHGHSGEPGDARRLE